MGSFEFPVDKYESQFQITRTFVALKQLPYESTEGPSLTLNHQVRVTTYYKILLALNLLPGS